LKVLLVDDEQEFADTLAQRLKMRGFDVQIAADGERALNLVGVDPPQVVILDVVLPGMSGLDVLKQIKARNPRLQVILLTGKGSTRDGITGMQLGAYDYLIKPLDIEELVLKMNAAAGIMETTR
jgi:DNA-binding response OmpR family regulator